MSVFGCSGSAKQSPCDCAQRICSPEMCLPSVSQRVKAEG